MEELARRWIPILVIQAYTLCVHVWIARRVSMRSVNFAMIAASAWMILVPPFAMIREAVSLPSAAISWLMAVSLLWVIAATSIALAVLGRTAARKNDPSRRLLLANTITALAVAPVAAAAAGIASARRIETVQRDIVLPGLPKDLHGLRIAQLTDIHYGPFFGAQDLRRAIAIANEWNPHLTVVTGDLITRRGDDLERCIQLLAGLRAEAGVFGCHGNHEMYSGAEDEATKLAARTGIRLLRQSAAPLRFGQARMNIVGYDYQRLGSEYLPGAERMIAPDSFNLLLQHNPDVLPRAAEAGFALTLAGHTHGGQINLDIAGTPFNLAAIYTPYTRGLYHLKGSALFVSSGLGTVAMPVRLGAPPEVSLLRLCAA
jgi:hypothetical protein